MKSYLKVLIGFNEKKREKERGEQQQQQKKTIKKVQILSLSLNK